MLLTDAMLSELEGKSTHRLRAAEVFDHAAFLSLLTYLRERAKELRYDAAIPKQIVLAILGASTAITSRAEYLPEVRAHLALANEFDVLLDLIARGEDPDGRKPSVPRIV
jgi:hypothetical protein